MVPCLCASLSGQQTEASLARAHERIKELEVCPDCVCVCACVCVCVCVHVLVYVQSLRPCKGANILAPCLVPTLQVCPLIYPQQEELEESCKRLSQQRGQSAPPVMQVPNTEETAI